MVKGIRGWWSRQSLRTHFVVLTMLVLATGSFVAYTVARNVYQIIVEEQEKALFDAKLNEARSIADLMVNIGNWATHYNGLWARALKEDQDSVGSFLDQECTRKVDAKAGKEEEVCYQRKNPALVQREVADVIEKSAMRAKPRIVSDKFVNPNNAPNRFELVALENIRQSGDSSSEYYERTSGQLLYAQKIIGTPGCLKCHGTPAAAPASMRDKYPLSNGYGYEVGKVVGLLSVRLPLDAVTPVESNFSMVMRRLSTPVLVGFGAFVLTLLAVFVLYSRGVVSPLRRLTSVALAARDAELGEQVHFPRFAENEHESGNEIHQLSHAVKALHESLTISQELAREEQAGREG
jgi:hypothetical protein